MNKTQTFNSPRIVFGNNSIEKIGEEIEKLNVKRIFIVTSRTIRRIGIIDKIIKLLERYRIEVYEEINSEPSLETLNKCIFNLKKNKYDLVVGIGGGSVLDVAKASAVLINNSGKIKDCLGINKIKNPGLKKILIPTTAGTGSEVTNVSVFINGNEKVVMYSPYLFADLAIVDPLLTVTMPKKVTAETGADALGHAIESYISINANPITEALSLKSIELIGKSLKSAVKNGDDIKARYNMSFAATLSGIAFINAGCNLGHALALSLGEMYKLPHGLSVALATPPAMEFNIKTNLSKFATISKHLDKTINTISLKETAYGSVNIVKRLLRDIGIPSLSDVGIKKHDIVKIAKNTLKTKRLLMNNPCRVSVKGMVNLLKKWC